MAMKWIERLVRNRRRPVASAAWLVVLGVLMRHPAGAQDAGEPPRPADIDPLTSAELHDVLEAHRGHVTLVNLWATWCAPCLREVPELLELEADLAGRGFRLIAISLDDADAADTVREFRDRWFPTLKTYHYRSTDWSGLIEPLDPAWAGILPTSFLIDRDGTVVATIAGGRDYAAFEAAVAPLL